jgi:membrane-bound lytic murein transglycosylase MltF
VLGNTILQKILYILIFALFWALIAPLTQLAFAEAPTIVDETNLPEVPEYKQYALKRVVKEWSLDEWEAFNKLVQKESSWDNLADNPSSTAFGTMQFLDSTWGSVGCVKTVDQNKQIDCGIKYLKARYNKPSNALQFHNLNGWY